MSNANAVRDWRIYADFAQHPIGMARELYAGDTLPDLEGLDTVCAPSKIDPKAGEWWT